MSAHGGSNALNAGARSAEGNSVSTAWPLDATADDALPLPAPWDGNVDLSDRQTESALYALQYSDPALALRVCRKVFCAAEAEGDGYAALNALFTATTHARHRCDFAQVDQLFALVRQRAHSVVRSSLATRIDQFHAGRLRDRGEFAQAMITLQNALGTALALGDDRTVFFVLFNLAIAAADVGDHETAMALLERQAQFSPGDDETVAAFRGLRANTAAVCLAELAKAQQVRGDRLAAAASLREARGLALTAVSAAKNDSYAVHFLLTLVEVFVQLDEAATARDQLALGTAGLQSLPVPGTYLRSLLQLAEAMIDVHVADVREQTIDALRAMTDDKADQASLSHVADAQRTLLAAYEQRGQFVQALACHKRCTDWKARNRSAVLRQRTKVLRHSVLSMRAEAVEFITHDLLTPLATAQTWSQALLRDHVPPASAVALRDANKLLADAAALSNQYLGLLRAELMPRARLQVLDFGALADDVCERLVPSASSGLRLLRAIDIGTPVVGDATLLTRAVSALLADAFARAPAGTQVELRLKHEAKQGRAELSISHRGVGPTAKARTHLYRLAFDGSVFGAGNLGLTLAAKVCRLHCMRLRFEAVANGGSKLRLTAKTAADVSAGNASLVLSPT
jgi:signal transduction histidine kinase